MLTPLIGFLINGWFPKSLKNKLAIIAGCMFPLAFAGLSLFVVGVRYINQLRPIAKK